MPPPLPDELLEEIFLRLPPDEPEWLVRASLASKLWLGRLTSPLFQGRYSEFHRSPPMLGFFYSSPYFSVKPPLVSTTKFRACIPDQGKRWYSGCDAWDCRHGRVLHGPSAVSPMKLLVWDPITGCRTELNAPAYDYRSYGAAVLCAVNGCDHRACHTGPSRVVFVALDIDHAGSVIHAYESLLEAGEWSKPCSGLRLGRGASIELVPPVLIQDTLYFKLVYDVNHHVGILKYDLCSKSLSVIGAPFAEIDMAHITILMGMEDGSLGFAHLNGFTLNLWSMQMGSDGVGSWSECRIIDLKEFHPKPEKRVRLAGSVEGEERVRLAGSVEGGDIIFITTELGIYKINLKSLEWKKIWKKEDFRILIPYMSFYYPKERANPYVAAH